MHDACSRLLINMHKQVYACHPLVFVKKTEETEGFSTIPKRSAQGAVSPGSESDIVMSQSKKAKNVSMQNRGQAIRKRRSASPPKIKIKR